MVKLEYMKKTIIALIVIIILGLGIYFFTKNKSTTVVENPDVATTTPSTNTSTTTVTQNKEKTVLGNSVQGNEIAAYHFGAGTTNLLIVGGIHGGYEWNTVLAAYELMDYLKANPTKIPKNVRVTVIPVLNPDGLKKVVGTTGTFEATDVASSQSVVVSGRFNANNVDLNRNFDCDWKATGTWQSTPVSGGSKAFSEPESLAFKNYIEANKPAAVVVLFSSAGGVYSSSCGGSILPETTTITNLYADASDYPAHKSFDSYETSGDMTNWLAKNTIPAISVLLTNHSDTERTKNVAGVEALLNYYGNKNQ
jgi:predicted deacylase